MMDLVEGVANEVLFAVIVTILLIVVAVFYTFFSEGTRVTLTPNSNVDRSGNQGNIDGRVNNDEPRSETRDNVAGNQSETRDNVAGNQSETNASVSSTAREEACNLPQDRKDSGDVTEQNTQSESTTEDNVRRRMVNSPESRQEQSTNSQDEIMVVKVKHNENIQTFNVSKNTTVIELKR
jgi:biopolymer transport protein ExbD